MRWEKPKPPRLFFFPTLQEARTIFKPETGDGSNSASVRSRGGRGWNPPIHFIPGDEMPITFRSCCCARSVAGRGPEPPWPTIRQWAELCGNPAIVETALGSITNRPRFSHRVCGVGLGLVVFCWVFFNYKIILRVPCQPCSDPR